MPVAAPVMLPDTPEEISWVAEFAEFAPLSAEFAVVEIADPHTVDPIELAVLANPAEVFTPNLENAASTAEFITEYADAALMP